MNLNEINNFGKIRCQYYTRKIHKYLNRIKLLESTKIKFTEKFKMINS